MSDCTSSGLVGWLLFFVLGICPWVIVNGIFIEIPVFTVTQPEGEGLAATIGAVVQIGNIAPFLSLAARHYCNVSQGSLIITVFVINISAGMLLAMFCEKTINDKSIPLLTLVLLASLGSCMSKIVWYPFAATFRQEAITAMSVGMGLSGLVVVVLGAAQNANKKIEDLRFQPKVFFIILSVVCLCGFLTHAYVVVSKKFLLYWKGGHSLLIHANFETESVSSSEGNSKKERNLRTTPSLSELSDEVISILHTTNTCPLLVRIFRLGTSEILLSLVNSYFNYLLMPGIFPYLQSDQGLLFWVISLYYITNMLGRYAPSFIKCKIRTLWILICVMIAVSGYIMSIAVMKRPWVSVDVPYWWVSVAVPISIFALCSGYISTMIPATVKQRELVDFNSHNYLTPIDVEMLLQVVGLITQLGSVSGTYTTFGLSAASVLQSVYTPPTATITLPY